MTIQIIEANSDELLGKAKKLFLEYAESLGFDLCFQNFDSELDDLPGEYAQPNGNLFLALSQNQAIGCVAIRYFDEGICEMKRLYVKPNFRGTNAGRALAEAAINAGKIIGYEKMRLDTLISMESANQLYNSLGFIEIQPYRYNPLEGAKYFELSLKNYKN
jgi:ribosomal protein S18 acetylase RimI-like enzyme